MRLQGHEAEFESFGICFYHILYQQKIINQNNKKLNN